MKKKIILITIIFLLLPVLVIVVILNQTFQKSPSHIIILEETGFSPQQLTINKGDSITFKTTRGKPFWPASDLHPTHGIYPEFDPQEPIDLDKSWSFTFKKSGSWRFHDHLSPFYRGTITVK